MFGIRFALLAAICAQNAFPADVPPQDSRRVQERVDAALRKESDALVKIADAAAHDRRVPSDFPLAWRNDFFKAQPGTFVPFTVTFTAPELPSRLALLYVRVVRQADRNGRQKRPPAYETIFPVRIEARPGSPVAITRP